MSKSRDSEWSEAKQRCRLTEEAIDMAKQLGMSPRSLIKNIPNKSERWKAPVEDWVRGLYGKRFGQRTVEPSRKPEPHVEEPPVEPVPDAPNELEVAQEELYRRFERGELDEDTFSIAMDQVEREAPVSDGEINDENRILLKRRDSYRKFADLFAQAASKRDFVQRIVLFGSVAAPLKKEVPRFRRFRRAGIAVWHECNDVDFAVWVSDLSRLRELKRAVSDATNLWQAIAHRDNLPGVPHHAAHIHLLEPGSNRYQGNLCMYGQCPKGKPECDAVGCGAQPFLLVDQDYKFDRLAPFGENVVVLFERQPAAPESPNILDQYSDNQNVPPSS